MSKLTFQTGGATIKPRPSIHSHPGCIFAQGERMVRYGIRSNHRENEDSDNEQGADEVDNIVRYVQSINYKPKMWLSLPKLPSQTSFLYYGCAERFCYSSRQFIISYRILIYIHIFQFTMLLLFLCRNFAAQSFSMAVSTTTLNGYCYVLTKSLTMA